MSIYGETLTHIEYHMLTYTTSIVHNTFNIQSLCQLNQEKLGGKHCLFVSWNQRKYSHETDLDPNISFVSKEDILNQKWNFRSVNFTQSKYFSIHDLIRFKWKFKFYLTTGFTINCLCLEPGYFLNKIKPGLFIMTPKVIPSWMNFQKKKQVCVVVCLLIQTWNSISMKCIASHFIPVNKKLTVWITVTAFQCSKKCSIG